MPIYDFRCSCGWEGTRVLPVEKVSVARVYCSVCGEKASRVWSAPAIHFKGKGFYNTDYKNKVKGDKQAKDEKKDPQETKKDADKKVEKKDV